MTVRVLVSLESLEDVVRIRVAGLRGGHCGVVGSRAERHRNITGASLFATWACNSCRKAGLRCPFGRCSTRSARSGNVSDVFPFGLGAHIDEFGSGTCCVSAYLRRVAEHPHRAGAWPGRAAWLGEDFSRSRLHVR